MRIFGVSFWTIFIVLVAMILQSKYSLVQRIPIIKNF